MRKVAWLCAGVAICTASPVLAQNDAAAKNMWIGIDAVYRAMEKPKPEDRRWAHTCQNADETCTYVDDGSILQANAKWIAIWPNNTTDPDAVIDACATAFSKFTKLNAKRVQAVVVGAFAQAQMNPSEPIDYYGIGSINFHVTWNHSSDPTLKCRMVDRRG